MALQTFYVNTDASPGGNGSTNNLNGANRAYSSLAEYEAAEAVDLVAAGDNHVVNCSSPSGVADTGGGADFFGWTTGAGAGVDIIGDNPGPQENRTDKYHMEFTPTADYQQVISSGNQTHITIDSIQIYCGDVGSWIGFAAVSLANGYNTIDNCMTINTHTSRPTPTDATGISLGWGGELRISNCVSKNFYRGIRWERNPGQGGGWVHISYNTAYDNAVGFDRNSYNNVHGNDTTFANNLGVGNGTDYSINTNGTGTPGTRSNNASSDATAPFPSAQLNVTTAFVDAANNDFHLEDGSDVRDDGVSLASEVSTAITLDAEGDTRDATTPDIGADENLSAGGTTGTIAETLDDVTSTASGTVTNEGTIAETVADASSTATGEVVFVGTIAESLADFSGAATGAVVFEGSLAETLQDATATATGLVTHEGSLAETLEDFTSTATGTSGDAVTGTIAETLEDAISSATGTVTNEGTSASNLEDATSSASGLVIISGSLAETLDDATANATGTTGATITGTLASTLEDAVASAAGLVIITGTLSETLDDVTSTSVVVVPGIHNAAQSFPTGSTVTISLYDPATFASIPLDTNSCSEIGSTGIFVWNASNLTAQPEGYQEYVYSMTDGTTTKSDVLAMGSASSGGGRGILRSMY